MFAYADVTMTDVNIWGNTATEQGGGYQGGGSTHHLTRVLIKGNTAPTAANILPSGALIYYKLPAVDGHWLPDSDCRAVRAG